MVLRVRCDLCQLAVNANYRSLPTLIYLPTHPSIHSFIPNVLLSVGEGGITSAVDMPPKNSRAAGLRSAEREQRDRERAEETAMTFQDQKLQFEKERAAFMHERDKG